MALPKPAPRDTKEWPRHPAGTFQLLLADVIYLGHRVTEWKGTRKAQERIAFIWQSLELEPERHTRFELATEFTYSVFDRATLRGFLETWLGAFQSEADAEAALTSIDQRVGENVIGTIVHKKSEDGKKLYVNVTAVSPLMKGMQPQAVVGYERNKFWTEKTAKYHADYHLWLAEQAQQEAADAERFSEVPASLSEPEDDGSPLPF